MKSNCEFSIIICTINRASLVMNLVSNLIELHAKSNFEIVIVENSGDDALFEELNERVVKLKTKEKLYLVKSYPGLPTARNLGVSVSSGEFIVFLDDDIYFEKNFLDTLKSIFYRDDEVVGVGASIQNATLDFNKPRFCFANHREGKITKSGRAFWFTNLEGESDVDWIPGCFMAYRRRIFESIRFDPNLQKGPTKGYALGEDLDFSLRANKFGKLIATGEIRINHNFAKNGREDWDTMDPALGRLLAHLARSQKEKVRFSNAITFLVFSSIYIAITRIVPKIDGRNRRILGRISAFVSECNTPTLIDMAPRNPRNE
jgi:GT2 family glycosyltransferase